VNEAEHGGVGANAKRENDHSRDGESWRLEKLPEGELKILDHMRCDAPRPRSDSKIEVRNNVAPVGGAGKV
jgi:hypothetical protein